MSNFEFKSVLVDQEGVKATVYRRKGRSLVAVGAGASTPGTPAEAAEATGAALTATFGEGADEALPLGKRDLTLVKIGRRKRRIYRVAAVDLESQGHLVNRVGWYIDTLRPPSSWMNNDPIGPYATREACLCDAERASEYEEDAW